MIFKEPRVMRHVLKDYQKPEVNRNSIIYVPIDGTEIVLSIFVTTVERMKKHTQFYGYFLDDSQWYLVDLLCANDVSEVSTLVLSTITPPSLRDTKLLNYYQRQIEKIPDLKDNLA